MRALDMLRRAQHATARSMSVFVRDVGRGLLEVSHNTLASCSQHAEQWVRECQGVLSEILNERVISHAGGISVRLLEQEPASTGRCLARSL